jgi:hypothetical protein
MAWVQHSVLGWTDSVITMILQLTSKEGSATDSTSEEGSATDNSLCCGYAASPICHCKSCAVCIVNSFLKFLCILTLESFCSSALGLAVGAVAPSTATYNIFCSVK